MAIPAPPPGFNLIDNPAPQEPETGPEVPQGFEAVEQPATVVAQEPNIIDRLGEKIGQRVEKVERASDMYDKGEISYPEFAMRGFGFAYGSLFDVVGEGVMSLLSAMTPDQAEAFLQEQVAAGGTALMNTEEAQEAMRLWNSLPQRAKDNIGDAFTIGAAAAPKGAVGKKLTDSALNSEKKTLAKFVLPQTERARAARAAEVGAPKSSRVVTQREDDIVNTVLSVPGVSSSASRKKIMESVNKELAKLQGQVVTSLRGVNIKVPKASVIQNVTQRFQGFLKNNPVFMEKKFKGSRDQVQAAFRSALKDYDGTPAGILKVRQRFDSNVEKLFRKDVHAGDDVHREMVAELRNGMNDMLEELAPDQQIRASMRRQHHLMVAKENLAGSIAREPKLVDKAIRKIESHPVLTVSALGGGGMMSNLAGSEALGVGMLAAGTAYGATRPIVRQAAGGLLSGLPVTRGTAMTAAEQAASVVPGIEDVTGQ